MKANGVVADPAGFTVPAPFSVIVTLVVLPPKLLVVTVIGAVPQVDPLTLLSVTVGPLTHPHDTSKLFPVAVQLDELITVTV